jgi:predicted DCC family thiol-disulfide oxidoreductase YuxK
MKNVRLREKANGWLALGFQLDLRSLALFRVAIGLTIVADVILRSFQLTAHYTDQGVLPRDAAIALSHSMYHLGFHLFSGQMAGQIILFAFTAFFGLALTFGYRTRLMTFLCWLMVTSVCDRNTMVIQGGDILLRVLLFWSFFLPLGARFSIDSALKENLETDSKSNSWLSVGTVAFTAQMLFIYVFAALIKMEVSEWREGLGVYYALNALVITTWFGEWLGSHFEWMKAINTPVMFCEFAAAFMLFVPWRNYLFRILAVLIFIGMHLSFAMTLKVGLFSPIACSAWLAFLPAEFWDSKWMERRKNPKTKLSIYFDGACGVCRRMLAIVQTFLVIPREWAQPAQSVPSRNKEMEQENSWVVVDALGKSHYRFDALVTLARNSWMGRVVCLVNWSWPRMAGNRLYRAFADHRPQAARWVPDFHERCLHYSNRFSVEVFLGLTIIYVFGWNLGTLEKPPYVIPSRLHGFGYVLGIDQRWNMFSKPIIDDGWYVIPGRLRDGQQVDLFFNDEPVSVSWEKPENISATFQADRWRKYMLNFLNPKNEKHRLQFGRYLCRNWNSQHWGSEALEIFEIYYMRQDILSNGTHQPKPRPVKLWEHECFDGSLKKFQDQKAVPPKSS